MDKVQTFGENKDFRRLYARGKSFVHPLLVTYCLKNKTNTRRYGITVSVKVGGAVTRNRAKRVIREAFRILSSEIPPGWDIIFVARTKTAHVKMPEVLEVMRKQLKKAGVLQC